MNNYMQIVNSANPPRCECHECTQARWKTSMQGQLAGAIGSTAASEATKALQQQLAGQKQAQAY